MIIICPKCEKEFDVHEKYNLRKVECEQCQTKFVAKSMIINTTDDSSLIQCSMCNKKISPNAKVCVYCGEPIKKSIMYLYVWAMGFTCALISLFIPTLKIFSSGKSSFLKLYLNSHLSSIPILILIVLGVSFVAIVLKVYIMVILSGLAVFASSIFAFFSILIYISNYFYIIGENTPQLIIDYANISWIPFFLLFLVGIIIIIVGVSFVAKALKVYVMVILSGLAVLVLGIFAYLTTINHLQQTTVSLVGYRDYPIGIGRITLLSPEYIINWTPFTLLFLVGIIIIISGLILKE